MEDASKLNNLVSGINHLEWFGLSNGSNNLCPETRCPRASCLQLVVDEHCSSKFSGGLCGQLMARIKNQKLDRWRNGMECDIFFTTFMTLWLWLLWLLWSLLLCYYHHFQRYGYYSYGLYFGIILLMIINYYHNVPIVGFMMTVMIMDMMLVIGNMMAKKHCDDW